MKRLAILISALLLLTNVQAQKKITAKADKAFEAGKYFSAIDLYKYSYSKAKHKEKKAEIIFKVAECYRNTGNTKQAKTWYAKAIKKKYMNPLIYLYYADALKGMGEYDEALAQYKEYKRLVPSDTRGKVGVESCEKAKKWLKTPSRYKVVNMYYFNSKQNDYSPTFINTNYKQLLFTSDREGGVGKKTSAVTGNYYYDLFKTRVDRKGKWSEPVPLGEGINSDYDEGATATNSKCNTLYFTSFRENSKKNLVCKIFSAKKDGIDWTDAKEITLANDSITVGHPAISNDELTLVFSADMAGGQGNKDLWKVTRKSKTGEWGEPVNMGSEINTAGNEMFPYFHPDGTLYFASDGHVGMGGLDIFRTSQSLSGKWTVENMKSPINSSSDDFGICFEANKERGYFSSNRDGGRGGDDIYQFSLPPIEFKLLGTVRNQQTEGIIAGAKVTIVGSDGTNVSKKTEKDGTFSFKLSPNTDYRILVKRGGFLNSKGKETTKGIKTNKEFKMDIFMSPDDSRIDLPGIMYDFGKWNLRPESLVSLEALVEILNDNPNITIEIGSHTDSRGSDAANNELSGKRANSVVKFLITYGIDEERLSSKGYGKTMPKKIDKQLAKKYDFLNVGDVLTESFINKLPTEEKREIAHQINRRTDFGLTGRDYVPKIKRRR